MWDEELPAFLCSHPGLWNVHSEGEEKSNEKKEKPQRETNSDRVIIILVPSVASHRSFSG